MADDLNDILDRYDHPKTVADLRRSHIDECRAILRYGQKRPLTKEGAKFIEEVLEALWRPPPPTE
jgi:hypothetical protein